MTTIDSSFVANGPAAIGFDAQVTRRPFSAGQPFKLGALAVGHYAGVYGATDDVALPPAQRLWDNAGVMGASVNHDGVAGRSDLHYGVLGQSGANVPSLLPASVPATTGVLGLSDTAKGVFGASTNDSGVEGSSRWGCGALGSSFNSPGVLGSSWGNSGVTGVSTSGNGVYGSSTDIAGVYGVSASDSGVFGVASTQGANLPAGYDSRAGVTGSSQDHPGVTGASTNHFGVLAYSKTAIGIWSECAPGGAGAGHFKGDVTVEGNVTITGMVTAMGAKPAAVPFPDGSRRLLYCTESPLCWFEDFGSARLARGRAVVKLDADFAKVVKLDECHVFLTPEGDCRGLYVRRKGGGSFEVRELQGGSSSVRFSYRIVARRKDVPGKRFAKAETAMPQPPKPAHRTQARVAEGDRRRDAAAGGAASAAATQGRKETRISRRANAR